MAPEISDHEARLRLLERQVIANDYRLRSLEGWRGDVAPTVADLDDLLEHERRRSKQRRAGVTRREKMLGAMLVTLSPLFTVVVQHFFH